MTAPAGTNASVPLAPVGPIVPSAPGAPCVPAPPGAPAGPGSPAAFHDTRRSLFLHFVASRINPLVRPLFFAQAVIFLGAALVAKAPNADAVTPPTTASRHIVATTFTYVTRGIAANVTRAARRVVKGWEG
jgi:hypothetical protein